MTEKYAVNAVAVLFGCVTGTAIVSLLWLMTGNPWLIIGVLTVVLVLYMIENLGFHDEVGTLEAAVRLADRKNEQLRAALMDTHRVHVAMMVELEACKRRKWKEVLVQAKSAKF